MKSCFAKKCTFFREFVAFLYRKIYLNGRQLRQSVSGRYNGRERLHHRGLLRSSGRSLYRRSYWATFGVGYSIVPI